MAGISEAKAGITAAKKRRRPCISSDYDIELTKGICLIKTASFTREIHE